MLVALWFGGGNCLVSTVPRWPVRPKDPAYRDYNRAVYNSIETMLRPVMEVHRGVSSPEQVVPISPMTSALSVEPSESCFGAARSIGQSGQGS